MLLKDFPSSFRFSVSCTTRKKRENERDGIDYYFLNKEDFELKLKQNFFLEHDNYANNLYGTLKSEYDKAEMENKICLFEMNINGVKQLKECNYVSNGIYIFVKPPNTDILLSRLKKRNTENPEQINKRMYELNRELDEANNIDFNMFLVNDDLTKTYEQLKEYLMQSYQHLRSGSGSR
ncbi:guanylate kinase, putative [Plasmodium malariae]|nr:guanylate kinase, putative [Plasmodium malariae]SBT71064.1 guanylate kinase, putative [Plasmodium malariae]SBT87942.1 guanylate kinase, putative [Plasmodium malariae]